MISRDIIETVATEEAERARITPIEVLGASKRLVPSAARKRALVRLVRDLGFSISAVAKAWGCDRTCIQRALREDRRAEA